MAYKDLREYIARLEGEGEVLKIEKEVDWNLEVGAIIRRSYDLKAPAPFFQKIKDYPKGYRILGAPLGTSNKPNRYHVRLALSMDMKPESSVFDIIEEYIKRRRNPLKPILVSKGLCKENIQIGDEIDLFKFPAPMLHEGDGGRYISTWHTMITKDPDSDWVNWGMYRQMIHDKKILGASFDPFRHIGIHYYGKYEPNNRPMECAVVIGTDPVIPIITITDLPPGISEVDIAGGIRGEPVELVRCETLSLLVPANAEIVFEGEILPRERMMEGPFGEYTGYRVGEREPRPVLRVKAITHRNDPILTCSCMGVPVDDAAAVMPIMKAGELLLELRDQGFPVKMVYCPPEGVHHLAIVSTKVPYPNYASHLANAIWGSSAGKSSWYLMIVEDDVDVSNMEEVIWALTTRCHPDRGIFKVPSPGGRLLSFLSPEERRKRVGAQVLFDCTWPKDWPKEAIPVKASFDVLWPKEIQDKVLKNWREYGYME